MNNPRPWHLGFLGFTSAWWLLALAVVPSELGLLELGGRAATPVHRVLSLLPFALPVGLLLAFVTLTLGRQHPAQTFAAWFLVGALSIAVVLIAVSLLWDLAARVGLVA
jgi:hypothetical protein